MGIGSSAKVYKGLRRAIGVPQCFETNAQIHLVLPSSKSTASWFVVAISHVVVAMRRLSSFALVSGVVLAVCNCFQQHGPVGGAEGFSGSSEDVLQNCLAFFVALAYVDIHTDKQSLKEAAMKAYGLNKDKGDKVASSIKSAISFYKYKVKCAGSGKFLPAYVASLRDAIAKGPAQENASSSSYQTPDAKRTSKTGLWSEPGNSCASSSHPSKKARTENLSLTPFQQAQKTLMEFLVLLSKPNLKSKCFKFLTLKARRRCAALKRLAALCKLLRHCEGTPCSRRSWCSIGIILLSAWPDFKMDE